jgi:hypothetical protein
VAVRERLPDVPAGLQRGSHTRAGVRERLDAKALAEPCEDREVRDLGDQPATGDAEPEAGSVGGWHGE